MITETILENGLIRRKSDLELIIRNIQTGGEYAVADDLPNDKRMQLGLVPYVYVETDKPIVVIKPLDRPIY